MYMHEFALALLLLVFTERCKEAMHGIGMHVSMTAILGNVFSMNQEISFIYIYIYILGDGRDLSMNMYIYIYIYIFTNLPMAIK